MDKGDGSPPKYKEDYLQLAAQLRQNGPSLKKIEEDAQEVSATVGQIQLEIAFDTKLKEMAGTKQDVEGGVLNKQEKGWVNLLRKVVFFVYFAVIPYCMSPGWCLQYYHDNPGERGIGLYDCDAVSAATGYRYSAFPTLSPSLTTLFDFACLICFALFACYETKYTNQSKNQRVRQALLVIALAVSVIDLVRCFFAMKSPIFADLMRVPIVLSFWPYVRQSVRSIFGDLVDSFAILMVIFTYILVFSFTVYYFYRPMFEGISQFGSIRDTYRNMTILFTTANFPDIFLPAMNVSYWNSFLFMFFMLAGLYFLTNLLTANVFNKYQQRLESRQQKRRDKREQYIRILFDKHDKDNSGVLDRFEAQSFLADVFDYDYHKEYHRNVAANILRIVDVDNNQQYRFERFLQFFKLPNFIEIAELENLSSLEAMAQAQAARRPDYLDQWPVEQQPKSFFDGWMQVVLILLNVSITVLFILNDQFKEKKQIRSGFWRMMSIPFTAVFFVEAAIVILTVDGASLLQSKKLYILEVVCQAVSIYAYVLLYTDGTESQYAQGASMLSFAFLLRNLRISELLKEVKSFKVIMDMLMRMTVPILYQLACLYIIFYIFGILGIYGLGGVIRQPNFHSQDGIPNNLYYLINFNDLGSSMVTLFSFMIINNWPAITDMMVNASGEVWPRIFFMVFYILVQWIILNIVIAMMLDIFCTTDSEVEKEFKRGEYISRLQAIQKRVGDARFTEYCQDMNHRLMKEEVDSSELVKRTHENRQDKAGDVRGRITDYKGPSINTL